MRHVKWRQWFMLALSGLLLLMAFYLSGGRAILVGMVPTVFAANGENARANSDCTNEHHNPSFGGTIVVDYNEVECGNLTTFGSKVAINGEVQGNVVAYNSDIVIAGTVDGKYRTVWWQCHTTEW